MGVRKFRSLVVLGLAVVAPSVREALSRYALLPAAMTPDQFGAFIRTEMERNGRIIKKLDLKLE
jgi:tripartite-type tricarboxylate transporter receptor subunit TctC